MKRRIAFVCERLQPRGAERILIHLASHLDRDAFVPHLVLLHDGNPFAADLGPDVAVTRVPPAAPDPPRTEILDGWAERVSAHLPMNGALVPALAALAPDLIVSLTSRCNLRLALEADRLPAPLVIGEMSLSRRIIEAQYPAELHEPLWRALGAIYRAPRRIVAVARVVADGLTREVGVDPARVATIPPAVDLGRIAARTAAAPGHPWFEEGKPLLMAMGALVPAKNTELALRALALLPEARLLVVGDGPRRPWLERTARREGVQGRVAFVGVLPDPLPWLARADVLVQSSHFEGTPTAVLEAMACGVSVVATAVGGTPEIVEHERTGLLVPPDDPRAMAGAIERLLSDRELRDRCRRAGRASAERTDAPRVTRQYEDVFRAAIAS
jgi:glycosyltransferase involved in cell wall biosynthesis